ncbi:MAG: DUF1570 domain-containing protein, partial [Fuerstia sp.]|nr:DUF1570 domain-containing protein [Fuerstiella sp.]
MQSKTQKNQSRARIVRHALSRTLCAGIALLTAVNVGMAGNGPRMIEVSDDTQTYTGMIVAKSAQECFIFDRFGRQARLPIANLKSFSVVAENFRPASQSEFRRQLEAELGKEYEVATSKHYVVAGTHGHGRSYAALFEDIYNQVDSFYSLRGFRTSDPEAPLVAIVLKDKAALKKYCEGDQMAWNEGLRGYYSLKSNRVVMYDLPELFQSVRRMPESDSQTRATTLVADANSGTHPDSTADIEYPVGSSLARLKQAASASAVGGETANTIIHETTHQVGFNIGIHSRIGGTPLWVLEGMATVLESPGMRTRSGSTEKVNADRLDWFKTNYSERRQPGDLAKLIASDDMFSKQTLDAYSAAWGITWFLTENPARARLFSKYLKTIRERDPLQPYTPEERLKDFETIFGDIARM